MDNKIKEIRLKKGFSQRKLAQAVGTSQQQIQRFETGAPVKLQIAGAIAEALGVTIPAVFPESKQGLERVLKTGDITKAYTNQEIEDSLLRAGIESDPCLWTARVLFKGGDPEKDIRFYKIDVADRKRLERGYLGMGTGSSGGFFHFDSDGKVILINLDHVMFWQNCFDPPYLSQQDEECFEGIDVYFVEQKRPLHFEVEPDGPEPESSEDEDEDGQFRALTVMLETGGFDKEEFIDFVDQDGEVAHLKVSDIAALEIARSVIHPEPFEDIEEEEEEVNQDEESRNEEESPASGEQKRTVVLPTMPGGKQTLTYNIDKHAVTCRRCGTSVTDMSRIKSEIRKALQEKGWSVGVPAWALHSPAIPPDEFYRRYPELKRKTFDTCPSCIRQGNDEFAEWMSQHYKEQESRTEPKGA